MHITFDNVSVANPDRNNKSALLKEISLQIESGEFICIIGLSGAGKSTLIRTLIGQHNISSGEIYVGDNQIPDNINTLRGKVGYIRQQDINPPALPAGRAFEYAVDLRLPESVKKEDKKRRVDEVLHNFGISHLVHVPVSKLSGGESKRGSIAVQLLSDPKILLLDEATSGLDAANESKVMKLLAEQAKRGTTILCVTHHLDNIDLSDKTLILNQGSIVWYGRNEAALEHFNVKRLPDIYQALDEDRSGKWIFLWKEKCTQAEKSIKETRASEPESTTSKVNRLSRMAFCFLALLKRNIEVLLRDRVAVLLLVLFPLVISALILGAFNKADFQEPILLTRKLEPEEKSVLAEVWGTVRAAVQAPSAKDLPADITPQIRVVLDEHPKILSHLQSGSADRIVSDVLGDRISAAPDKEIINPAPTYKYLFNVTTIVALLGFVLGIREHVRERHMFISESLHGVPVLSYLLSKTVFIGLVVLIQVTLMSAILDQGFAVLHAFGGGMPDPQYRIGGFKEFTLNWLLAFAAGMMGFVVSIMVGTIEQAFLVLPVLEVSQILLGGGVIQIREGVLRAISMTLSPAYWSFRGIRSESIGVPSNWHGFGDYLPSFKLPVMAIMTQIILLMLISYVLLLREEKRVT